MGTPPLPPRPLKSRRYGDRMSRDMDHTAYGIAAFALLERLLDKLLEKHLLSEMDGLEILDGVAKSAARTGLSENDEATTAASLLAGKLAASLRRRL